MPIPYVVVAFLVAQRLVELVISRRNQRSLLAKGGIEYGRGHYPLIVLLHVGWLLALLLLIPPTSPVNKPLIVCFVLLEIGRLWVMISLGSRWTTRVILVPGAQRVRRGPYRFLNHPNYLIVILEFAVVPLIFGAWRIAAVATVLNILVLRTRLQVENRALAEVYGD